MSKHNILSCILFFVLLPKAFCQLNANLLGDAVDQGNDCYLITPDLNEKYGAIWYDNIIDFTVDFEIVFDAYFGVNDADDADGMALVFKANPSPQLGGLGGELGNGGVKSSLIVEFDTWQNTTSYNDPVEDHIGLMLNGNSNHNSGLALAKFPNLENGMTHEVKFSWNASSKKITITKDCVEIISYTGDIVNLAFNGKSKVYFGFTGSTGGSTNEQKICFKDISFVEGLPDQDLCKGNILDTIDATFSGATSYSWTPTSGISDPIIPNPIFSSSTTTTYEITITQQFGNVSNENFTISAHENPVVSTPSDIKIRNATGINLFDLTLKETKILKSQSTADFSINYFTDSGYTNQIINPSMYSNTVEGSQTIYVRVANKNYGNCYVDTSFEIEVYQYPQVSTPNLYQQCDDASNDGKAIFNLNHENIKAEINPNYINQSFTYTYYETQAEAETNGAAVTTPFNYQYIRGVSPDTLWVSVERNNGCFSLVPLIISVFPSSARLGTYVPGSIYQSDYGVVNFDMTKVKNEIINTIFSSILVTVHFYETHLDAELETNEILDPANHQNTNSPYLQDIWIRVKNDLGNNSLGLQGFPNLLIVADPPIANPVPVQVLCDNDASINDGKCSFNTFQIESTILSGQSLTDVTIIYTYLEADGVTVINTSNLPNPFLTQSKTLNVRVTNNNTANPDGPCYDETFIEFIVDKQPLMNAVDTQIVCDGDSGDVDNDGLYPFDASSFINIIIGNQIDMEVYFDYKDETGSLVVNNNLLPNLLISGNQTISVHIINSVNNSCSASGTIDLIVNPLPDFSIETPQIVCSSDPTLKVVLDPFETNLSETFTYEWTDENGVLLSNNSNLEVSAPGTYRVTLTKTDGTGCSKTQEIFVNSSELAIISQDDITITDISSNNTITVNESNLGQGDYEYALDDAFSSFQEESIFKYVWVGIHTIYVKDKKGCGKVSIQISFINYPEFFTPNGDGNHDFWQIQAVNAQFQPSSDIYIFNRYGKLLKQLDPTSIGWKGSLNSALMPNDDYWLKVLLQDGRTFKEHFTLKR
jgi:gliding motility-associated-like protein